MYTDVYKYCFGVPLTHFNYINLTLNLPIILSHARKRDLSTDGPTHIYYSESLSSVSAMIWKYNMIIYK